MSLRFLSSSMRMLEGLISLCAQPISWRYSTAEMSSLKSLHASVSDSLANSRLPLLFLDVVGELPVLGILHHEEEVLGCLDDLGSGERVPRTAG